ncbi:unnamed protein product [Adineta steineri]|uniref:Uncharacterized protein n=1 Tax=Adineta steineri TaxID=433720 RepID=A0A815B2C3_9BILA|nr:unnamed protein product [Adineta steineri]CAF3629745.1 unnamed protein product [Adineta steineri]
MITTYTCQRCLQLPPPPPIFSLGPPPNILSIDIRCSSHFLSSSLSSIQHKKFTYSSSSSLSVSVALGFMIVLLISTSTILLIKNRMIKRRQERQKRYDDNSSSHKFNGHNHHHHQDWTKFIPLLSDSCSSEHTLSTPPSEYPCGIIEPFLTNDIQHEYEQIKYEHSLDKYCLVYCRQCANYHQTNLIQSNYQHQCTCHLPNDKHIFELHPMLRTTDNDDLNS